MSQASIDAFMKPATMMDTDDASSVDGHPSSSHPADFKSICKRLRSECNAKAKAGMVTLTCGSTDVNGVNTICTTSRFGSKGYVDGTQFQVECYCGIVKKDVHTMLFSKVLDAMLTCPNNNAPATQDLIKTWQEDYENARASASSSSSRGRSATPTPVPRTGKRNAPGSTTPISARTVRTTGDDSDEELNQALALVDMLTKDRDRLKADNARLSHENNMLKTQLDNMAKSNEELQQSVSSLITRMDKMEANYAAAPSRATYGSPGSGTIAPTSVATTSLNGENESGPSWSTIAARPPTKNADIQPHIERWAKEILAPPKVAVTWDKVCFRHTGSYKFKNISKVDKQQLIRSMFSIMGIWNKISLYSAIGRSVFEIYFPAEYRDEIIEAIGKNHCTVIDANANLDPTKETIVESAAKRLAFLLSIRDNINIQKCILQGTHQVVLDKLKTLVAPSKIDAILKETPSSTDDSSEMDDSMMTDNQ